MTTKETALALGVTERTIQRHLKELRKEGLTDNVVVRGNMANLNEDEITIIKNRICESGRKDLVNVVEVKNITTDIEMIQKAQDFMAWATVKIQEETEKRIQAENKILLDSPKVAFHDAVTGSKDTIDIGEAAKVLAVKGFGRNNLFERLRNEGILMQNNQPYQKYIDAGYFRTIESSFTAPDGTTHVNIKTVVYQKGLDFIRKVITK